MMMETKDGKNMYRFKLLLNAIDLFSQRFHIEQILDYAFEFTNQMYHLKASALFVREGNYFVLKKQKQYDLLHHRMRTNRKLDELPLFHGRILTANIHEYFDQEEIERFDMKMVVPLIIDTELAGYIVSNGKKDGEFEAEDLKVSDALMRLINHSLENNQRLLDLRDVNSELDRKIFNLLIVNQSTKALLSELNLDSLYAIATDVFSEVAGSKVTSFGIYDPVLKKIKISGYRNVNSFTSYYTELELHTRTYTSSNIVLHMERDAETIKSIFKNYEELARLEATYIVLIVKGEILGVVTLGDSVTGEEYSKTEFELIESLASTTYIGITNATLFEQISTQKEQAERKYDVLSTLNHLVRTITSCKTKEELYSLTLQTLSLGYGVKKAFICERNDADEFEVQYTIGLEETLDQVVPFGENLVDESEVETVYNYSAHHLNAYFEDESFIERLGETNGFVFAPICIDNHLDEGREVELFGSIVVLETKDNLKDEEILLIDTIATHISPIAYQMAIAEQAQESCEIDPEFALKQTVREKIDDAEMFGLTFNVFIKQIHTSPFIETTIEDLGIAVTSLEKAFVIGNYVFLVSYDEEKDESWIKVENPTTLDAVTEKPFAKLC
ncbi:GAF domain-containing protein [Bacillus tianshenii]|nr:GAF domain-containing protein [Bacillus tianshenii]